MVERIGDWLVTLDGRAPRAGRADAPWREAFRESDHALFFQAPSRAWVGWELRRLEDPRGRLWLFGDGILEKGPGGVSDEVLAKVAWDDADPATLGASFVLLHLDADGSFGVITDRLGTFHVYRGPRAFGSSMAAVAERGRRSPDSLGLAGFFAFGFFPGEHTFYDDVSVLGPARRYRLGVGDVGSWSSRRYWPWHHEPHPTRTYGETLDAFCDLFTEIMGEIDAGVERLAIPLSGGLDSRLALAALAGRREGRWAYSYGYGPRSAETRIARRLARRRELPFESLRIEPYLFDREAEVLAAVEGFQDVTQCRQVFVADLLRQRADAVIAAHWGDVWLDSMGLESRRLSERPEITPRQVVAHTLGRLRKRGRGRLLEALCEGDPEKRLEEWLAEALSAYEHIDDPDFRVKAFKTDHWSFRWTLASVRAYRLGTSVRLPFYDPRLVDFFTTVPTSFVAGRRLEIDAIKYLAPDLARVPWQVYDASLYTWRYFHSLHLPKRAVKKAWRLLRREKVIERNWEVQFLPATERPRLEDRLLRPGLRLHEWIDPAEVRRLLDDFWARPGAAEGYAVSMLLTFALWLETR